MEKHISNRFKRLEEWLQIFEIDGIQNAFYAKYWLNIDKVGHDGALSNMSDVSENPYIKILYKEDQCLVLVHLAYFTMLIDLSLFNTSLLHVLSSCDFHINIYYSVLYI